MCLMCADTYIALRSPLGSQKDHIPDLEELNHYSWSYGIIFMVKIMHFWPKVHTRSTLYDRPSLTLLIPTLQSQNFWVENFSAKIGQKSSTRGSPTEISDESINYA